MSTEVAELGIANASPSLGRVEDLRDPAGYAIVISRAFSDLGTFAEASLARLAPGGRLCAMKGVHPDEELRELPDAVAVEQDIDLAVPGVDGARHLIVLKRREPKESARS